MRLVRRTVQRVIVAHTAASTVAQCLAAFPADRRAALSAVRKAINENLADGYEEGMQFGMIGWLRPAVRVSGGVWRESQSAAAIVGARSIRGPLRQRFSFQGFSFSEGCVRFKKLSDLAFDVVGRTVARLSVEEHMANYQAARAFMGKGNSERVRERGSSAKRGARKSAVKKAKPKK